MRFALGAFKPGNPLEMVISPRTDGDDANAARPEMRWTSALTGIVYRVPLPNSGVGADAPERAGA